MENVKRRRLKAKGVVQFTVGCILEPRPGIMAQRASCLARLKPKTRYGVVGAASASEMKKDTFHGRQTSGARVKALS